MSRFPRLRRRPDHWSSPHERARAHAAERLDGPLGLVESSWLDEHLAGCPSCAAIAAAYEADRQALRSLREEAAVPPRDLWARTAAAIEREAGATAGASARAAGTGPRRVPVGVLSGLAVIVVIVGVSAVSGGLFNGSGGTAVVVPPSIAVAPSTVPSAASTPVVAIAAPTPIAVGAGDVQWLDQDADGRLAFKAAPVTAVCPVDASDGCATLDGSTEQPVGITADPKTIIGSPNEDQAVVVTEDDGGSQQVTVMALPTPEPAPTAVASASASARPTSVATAIPSATAPSSEPTRPPDATASPSSEPTPSEIPPSTAPSETPMPSDAPSPSLSPSPTVAATLAIASDVALVGEAAAYSPDGSWFAFTARPADGSAGPDVYVWHVGDAQAHRLTEDGQSYFGSWLGPEVLVSRPGAPGADGTIRAVTVAIDPASGDERPMGDLWRPVADPTGTRVVAWDGTLMPAADGTLVPGIGRLDLRAWSPQTGAVSTSLDGVEALTDTAMSDFDVQWDESGNWFAAWIADAAGTGVGRLSLHRLDPATGRLVLPEGAPTDVQSLPGFSIGEGRLAWATPPGQGGEGSRVVVVAWTGTDVGAVETSPGGDLTLVR